MTLAGIVACQVGNAFACRSESDSIWRLGDWANRDWGFVCFWFWFTC